jgi:hypothetical protein
MKALKERRGIALLFFLSFSFVGVKCQRHATVAFYSRERPGTHWTGDWMDPRAGLDRCGKSRPPPGFDPRTVQPVASRYTDCATWSTATDVSCINWQHSKFSGIRVLSYFSKVVYNIYKNSNLPLETPSINSVQINILLYILRKTPQA